MWLLLVIHLQFAPTPHVVNTELVGTFASEQNCREKAQGIFEQAERSGKPVPKEINLGCMPLNGRKA